VFDNIRDGAHQRQANPQAYAELHAELASKGEYEARTQGGENIADVTARITRFLRNNANNNQDLIIVAHGAVLNALTLALCGREQDQLDHTLAPENRAGNADIVEFSGDLQFDARGEIIPSFSQQLIHVSQKRGPASANILTAPVPDISPQPPSSFAQRVRPSGEPADMLTRLENFLDSFRPKLLGR
jgi:hypothetical protein